VKSLSQTAGQAPCCGSAPQFTACLNKDTLLPPRSHTQETARFPAFGCRWRRLLCGAVTGFIVSCPLAAHLDKARRVLVVPFRHRRQNAAPRSYELQMPAIERKAQKKILSVCRRFFPAEDWLEQRQEASRTISGSPCIAAAISGRKSILVGGDSSHCCGLRVEGLRAYGQPCLPARTSLSHLIILGMAWTKISKGPVKVSPRGCSPKQRCFGTVPLPQAGSHRTTSAKPVRQADWAIGSCGRRGICRVIAVRRDKAALSSG